MEITQDLGANTETILKACISTIQSDMVIEKGFVLSNTSGITGAMVSIIWKHHENRPIALVIGPEIPSNVMSEGYKNTM